MDLKEAIYTRRAVREFTAEPVPDETLRQLIDAAVQAPSAVNQQPWSFCVVRDKLLLARISGEAKAYIQNLAYGAIASFPRHSERSEIRYFLSCACTHRYFRRGGKPVGNRKLFSGGGKLDAGGPCRRIGNLLDRVCPDLAWNSRGKGGFEPSG